MNPITARTSFTSLLFVALSLNLVLVEGILTSRRLAIGAMLVVFILNYNKKALFIYKRLDVGLMTLILFMVVLFSVVSFVVNEGEAGVLGVYFVYTLIMQLFVFMLFSFCVFEVGGVDAKLLARLFIFIGLALAIIPLVAFFKEFNFATVTRLATIRNYIDDFLPRGQNFYLTFMSVFVSVGFASMLGMLKLSWVWRSLSLFLLLASIFLFIITGSRQFLLVVIGSCLIISIFSFPLRNISIVLIGCAAIFAVFYFNEYAVFDNVVIQTSMDRISNASLTGSQYDGGRVYRYEMMFGYISSSPFLGEGPNALLYDVNLYSDSSWLQLAAEIGLFPTLLIFLGVSFLVFYMFIVYFKPWTSQPLRFFYLALLSCFAVHSILLMALNDILAEYYLWLLVPILMLVRIAGQKTAASES